MKRITLLGLIAFSLLTACKDSATNSTQEDNQSKARTSTVEAPDSATHVSSRSASATTPQITDSDEDQSVAQLSREDWDAISDWEGIWKTSYGQMVLQETQSSPNQGEALTQVSGTYATDNGKIEAVIYDTGLTGYWIEDKAARKCDTQKQGSYYWGRIEFNKAIPDADKFVGQWSYCDEPLERQWSGERLESSTSHQNISSSPSQPPKSPQTKPFQAAWQGDWDTSEGRMALKFPTEGQDDTIVTGSYSQDGGRIEGYVQNNVLNGYWAENSSSQRCSEPRLGTYHWGRIQFVVNATGNEFDGKWSYCDAEPDLAWTGKRFGR